MRQTNTNRGEEALVPDYTSFDIGAFYYTQKRTDKTSWTGGLRYDQKFMNYFNPAQFVCPPGLACIALYDPKESNKQFNNITGAIGVAHDLSDQLTLKFNIERGLRAPNMAELASYGAHEGTNRFEYGNEALISEKSLQFDAALEWSNEHMSIAGNVFYNNVSDYIFYQKLTAAGGGDSIIIDYAHSIEGDELYAFAFRQKDAHLYGAEFNIDIHPHPLDWLHVENSVSLIRGQFNEALVLVNELKREDLKAQLLGNRATLYRSKLMYPEAISDLNEALGIYRELKMDRQASWVQQTLGFIYIDICSYELALKNLKGIQNDTNSSNSWVKMLFANNKLAIGKVYLKKEAYKDAQIYLESALKIFKEQNASFKIAQCYRYLSQIHNMLNETDKAINYATIAIELSKQNNDETSLIYGLLYLAEANFKNDIPTSIKLSHDILSRSINNENYEFNSRLYNNP